MRINTAVKAGIVSIGIASSIALSGCSGIGSLISGQTTQMQGASNGQAQETSKSGNESSNSSNASSESSSQEGGGLFDGIGTGLFGSGDKKNTSDNDREKYSTVQDTKGNEYVTIIHVVPVDDTDFNVSSFEQTLSDNNISWYQLIAGNNMGTGTQEEGYLYFKSDITYTELSNYAQILSKNGYETSLMSPDEYKDYVEKRESGPTDFYYNEMTYYGPESK